MANVTCIVGNGLDLSLNMHTSYRNFYDYSMAMKSRPKNKIYAAIKKDPETWSDFELALGKYTNYIEEFEEKDRKKASIEFHEELEEFTHDLADYLENQDKFARHLDEKVHFAENNFFEELPTGQKNRIQKLLSGRSTTINFITLNYTNTLEKIFQDRNALLDSSGTTIDAIHHIHGDLVENVTLGVSEESQLYEGMSSGEKADLIKPKLIASMNDDRIEDFKRILNGSDIVVLFGTSIGDTDRYIWDTIVHWLAFDSSRYLVIHKHDRNHNDSAKRISRRQKLFISGVQDRLLANSTLDNSQKSRLKSRIFVIHNTKKLFVM